MTVLSHNELTGKFDEIFKQGGKRENIRAAKYYLRLGRDLLILPNGHRYREGADRCRRFVVEPGQTAFVTTAERIVMPPNLVGMLSPIFDNAEHGVLFFGGMLVDPGYGLQHAEGEPLSFHIANVGAFPLELRPGEDRIASLAFLEVKDPLSDDELKEKEFLITRPAAARKELFPEPCGHFPREHPPKALGLVSDFGQVGERVERLEASVSQVILLVVIVLGATLLAAVVSTIFALQGGGAESLISIGGDSQGSEPSSETVAEVVGIVVFGVALLVLSFYAIAKVWAKARGLNRRVRLHP